jgi:3-hydroxyisobutyrate dehydrogenase
MSAAPTPRLGWIGLGKMGTPICRNLLAKAFPLAVYDIDPARAGVLAEQGARPAADLAALAAGADVVLSMVPDDDALRTAVLGQGGVLAQMAPGSVYVDLSTVSPRASEEVAAAAEAGGVGYVCAPVSGSTVLAEQAALTVFASGPADAYRRCEPVFAALAARQYYVGTDQQARYLKLAVNHFVGTTAVVMAEALALGRKGGLDWAQMLEVIGASVAASPLVKYKLEPLKQRDFAPAFSAAQMLKDMSLVAGAGAAEGVAMPLAALVRDRYADYAANAAGRDFFGIVEDVEARSGLPPLS